MAPEGVEGLIAKLKDPISSSRSDAATRLGLLHNKLAVGPLVETLNDPDIQVRNQVITALGQIGDEAAVEPLLALLSLDKDPYRRSLAVNALGKSRTASERIIPAIMVLVNDPIEEIRLAAIQALSLLGKGSEQIFDVVIEQLSDPNESIAFCAITGLGNLGNPRGLEPLLQELRSESFERRMAAADALGELGDVRAIPALEWSRDNDPYRDENGYCVHNSAGQAIKRILKIEDNDESIG